MKTLMIPSTNRTPAINFDFANHHLSLRGESYPEDTATFYGPLLAELKKYLAQDNRTRIVVDIEMAYFNSSSAKAMMNFFQLLESAAAEGKDIEVNWYYQEDDDTMQEFGEDFSEDMEHIKFNLVGYGHGI